MNTVRGQGGGELPPIRQIKEITDLGAGKLIVQEGLGPRGDIVLIGAHPNEWTSEDKPAMYFHAGLSFVATSKDMQFHAMSSVLIDRYLLMKDVDRPYSEARRTINESVRVEVGRSGPEKVYTLDRNETDPEGQKAAQVLRDLGVKDAIEYNPGIFMER